MELNIDNFNKLFEKKFHSSYAEAGRELDVAPAQIFRIRNNKGKDGAVFFGKLYTYCDKHNLNFKNYIHLPLSK